MPHDEIIPKRPSAQVKTILHYLDQVKVFNIPEIAKVFADDFVLSLSPSSLGMPSRTKEEDLAVLQGMANSLGGRHLEITIYDIIESPGKAWVHLLMHGEPPEGKPFNVECIYKITFTEHSTSTFKAITEFVDSKAYTSMS